MSLFSDMFISLIVCIILLRRAICCWLTLRIMGLLCLSVMDSVPCFTRVELMVLNISLFVTRSIPC